MDPTAQPHLAVCMLGLVEGMCAQHLLDLCARKGAQGWSQHRHAKAGVPLCAKHKRISGLTEALDTRVALHAEG